MSTPRVHPTSAIDLAGLRTITANRCRRWSLCGLIMVACTATPALEIQGDPPPWLTKTITPAWRLVPLTTVLDDLAKMAGITVVRSVAAQVHAQQPVLLLATKTGTLADTLTLLERCAPIRFTVTADAISVEDAVIHDTRRFELRAYQLNDYALCTPFRNSPLGQMGVASVGLVGGLRQSAPQAPDSASSDAAQIVDYIQHHVAPESWQREGAGIEQRDGTSLYIVNTPEVHAAIHAALTGLHDFANRSKRWQVTFGLLPKDERIATGIVTNAQAKAVTARFTTPDVLTLGGLLGQQIHAQTGGDHSQIVGADVINHHLDPRTEAVTRGHSVLLRAMDGQQRCLVNVRLGWVEDAEPAALVDVHTQTNSTPGSTTTTSKSSEARKDATAATELTNSTTLPQSIPGEHVRLDLPVLWTWRPEFECFLTRGSALILSTEHPRGQAVMVLEELP